MRHKNQAVAYVRVSSVDHNLGRQLEAGGGDWFFEKRVSGWVSSGSCSSARLHAEGVRQLRRAHRTRLLATRTRPPAVTRSTRRRNRPPPGGNGCRDQGHSFETRRIRPSSVSSDSAGLLD